MKGMEMDSYVVTNQTIDNVLASWIQPWNYQPTWKEISSLRSKQNNTSRFAEAEVQRSNTSPHLDRLNDSGVEIDTDLALLRVCGD
jgi:hypothetical protein